VISPRFLLFVQGKGRATLFTSGRDYNDALFLLVYGPYQPVQPHKITAFPTIVYVHSQITGGKLPIILEEFIEYTPI
jgi:hypothetical protein